MSELVKIVSKILAQGGVFIGYEPCALPHFRRLSVARTAKDVERFIYDPLCSANPAMTAMLLARKSEKKIGMKVRACEGRSIVECLKSRQLVRENLHVHAARCGGVIDPRRLDRLLLDIGKTGRVESVTDVEGTFRIDLKNGETLQVGKEELLARRCFFCRAPEDLKPDSAEQSAFVPPELSMPPEREGEDKGDWEKLLSGCELCMACRSACSGCFCRECIFESVMKKEMTPWMFHLTRTLHLAGRCTDCGECERACPAGLSVGKIRRKFEELIDAKYNAEGAGIKTGSKLPLLDWSAED